MLYFSRNTHGSNKETQRFGINNTGGHHFMKKPTRKFVRTENK